MNTSLGYVAVVVAVNANAVKASVANVLVRAGAQLAVLAATLDAIDYAFLSQVFTAPAPPSPAAIQSTSPAATRNVVDMAQEQSLRGGRACRSGPPRLFVVSVDAMPVHEFANLALIVDSCIVLFLHAMILNWTSPS